MADPAIVKRVRSLLARATDPGATEEEQRTSAHIAAKLCKQHGLNLGELGDAGEPVTSRARAEVTIDGVRTVIETVSACRAGIDQAFGFDVFAFAQGLIRERAQTAIASAIAKPPPAAAKPRKRKR